ncbi:MAG: 3-phosphoshikimate 1-carboxyvinyltransferase [Solirubrobacteraceae bacterium]|nr:3-phosphoshikimate 1-carboxyvinyltransferase [Solirubrobacteraceae bacterium]
MSASARFTPGGSLRGELVPPPDKSISHRAALLAAMAPEPVRVRNYLDSADTNSTLRALRTLGAVLETQPDEIVVRGTGLRNAAEVTGAIDVGNSGTLMRLLPGWLAAQPGGVWRLDGDESIRTRPVDRIAEPLQLMGARIAAREGRYAPFTVAGATLRGIDYEMPVASAQVKSCVLIAGLTTDEGTSVTEPAASRDHTERLLAGAGVPVTLGERRVSVRCVDELELDDVDVPGDVSSAAFLVAAGLIVPRSQLTLRGVGVNWTRTGFLRIARRMGAKVDGELEAPGTFSAREPVAELTVRASSLRATSVGRDEVPLAIDELPLVALLGCFAEGVTEVRGAGELRVKESDRIAAVVDGLRGLGADIEGFDDGFAVTGTGGLRGGRIESWGDHRLAMLGAVAGLASQEGVEVVGMEAVAVSYPGFVEDLARLAAR